MMILLKRVSLLTVLVFIMGVSLLSSALAQTTLPLPARASTELLNNASFETDTDLDKIPDGWTGKKTDVSKSDKLKCDKPENPVAHTGTCAFMFRGNGDGSASKLSQTISNLTGLVDGAAVDFSLYIDPRSGTPGSTIGKATLSLSDDSKVKLKLLIPPASRAVADYVQVSAAETLSLGGATVTKAKVDLGYTGTKGKFFVDDASLQVTAPIPFSKVTAPDGAEDDHMGAAIAISGNTVVVGANKDDVGENVDQGSAYVFVFDGNNWTFQQELTADDGAANDEFGASVAIDGDTIVVGSNRDDVGASAGQGSAYVFTRNGTTWTQQQQLTGSDSTAADWFGQSVAISGDTIAVGAYKNGLTLQGAVYIFTRSDNTWTEQQKLTASDGAANDHLGTSVAIDGDTLVSGASDYRYTTGSDNNRGAVYVFVRTGSTWSEQQKLLASDGDEQDHFGQSVTVEGDTAVIGAWYADIDGKAQQGAAYVFTRSGTTWTEQQKLTSHDGAAFDLFGISLEIDGSNLMIGANQKKFGTNSYQGAAYIFTWNGSAWEENHELVASDGNGGDKFGYSVSISGNLAAVGAVWADIGANTDQGAAYVYTLP